MAGAITAGMDIAQVRALAKMMTDSANEIQTILQRVTGALEATPWLGPDRTKFEQDWRSRQTQQLKQVQQALTDGARIATTNATEQETTSGR